VPDISNENCSVFTVAVLIRFFKLFKAINIGGRLTAFLTKSLRKKSGSSYLKRAETRKLPHASA
jgi:hypothetical protein